MVSISVNTHFEGNQSKNYRNDTIGAIYLVLPMHFFYQDILFSVGDQSELLSSKISLKF